jgi:hypothetical protein
MSRLAKLKGWVSIDEAAMYLQTALGETVAPKDLLQLAIQETLRVAVRFPQPICARRIVRIISDDEISSDSTVGTSGLNWIWLGQHWPHKSMAILDPDASYFDGIFELAMIGGEVEVIRTNEWIGNHEPPFGPHSNGHIVLRNSQGELVTPITILWDQGTDIAGRPNDDCGWFGLPDTARLIVKFNDLNAIIEQAENRTSKENKSNRLSWPWGEHETQYLRILVEAATQWWSSYEPGNNKTAPTNHEVSDWLFRERKISKNLADAMASILRADDLPTGPRT